MRSNWNYWSRWLYHLDRSPKIIPAQSIDIGPTLTAHERRCNDVAAARGQLSSCILNLPGARIYGGDRQIPI